MVRDLHRNAAGFADLDRLRDRVEQTVAFVAHVTRVETPDARHRAGERDEFLGRGVAAGFIDEAGRAADAPGRERVGERAAHAVELGRCRRAARVPHCIQANRAVADERRDVQARRLRVDGVEIVGVAVPPREHVDSIGLAENAEVGARDAERSRTEAAIADDVGRHALADLEVHLGHEEHREVVMAVHVDEAGRQRAPRCVDDSSRVFSSRGHRLR